MISPDLSIATSLDELCICLGIPSEKFESIIAETNPSNLYRQHHIPKKGRSGKNSVRTVWESRDQPLSELHKLVYLRLSSYASRKVGYPHPSAHGYVPGKSTRTNAEVHAGSKFLLRCDISNFFPSITEIRVVGLFLSLGLQKTPAELLARFTTIQGVLPLGLQASPLIANLVCADLDDDMLQMASDHNLRYSRYADDMSISGECMPLGYADMNEVVIRHGFSIAQHKFRVTKRGQAHFVTGLSISDASPRIPRRIKRRLRQELYYMTKYGIKDHLRKCFSSSYQSDINHIDGMLSYLNSIEPELAATLRAKWVEALKRDNLSQAYPPLHERAPRSLTYLIDESTVDIPGKAKVLALCCIVTEDESEISERVNSLVRRYLLDSSLPGNRQVLSTKGAHFTELSETFRGDYLQTVATIPFRAYVVYDQITGSDYEEKYLYLLSRLLTHRFIYSDRAEVTVVCEQNPRVALSRIAGLVSAAYESLEKKGSRRPICLPEVVCADKLSRQALSLSDAILWVFRSYALLEAPKEESSHRKSGELSERRFESIRHKIRLVLSLVSAEKFTLSKPFHPWQAGDPFVAQTRS